MAIKKFIIHDNVITYRFIENGYDLDIVIVDPSYRTEGRPQEKKISLTNKHFDTATGTLFFTIDDKPYKVNVSSAQPDQQAWQVSFSHKTDPITVHKHQEQVNILPAVQANSPQLQTQDAHPSSLKSPLAGRVSRVLVKPSERVKKGQPLLLIESMKMENEIGASRDAFIKTIFIAEGNVVQQNQILIDFECEGEADAITKNAHEQETVQNR